MEKQNIKGVNEPFYYDKLDNGLEVYMVPNLKVKNFYITLNVKFGSIYTKFTYKDKIYNLPKGVAHYLEHLTFNMPEGSAFDYFGKLGSNVNAFTSYDVTCYEVFANNNFKDNLAYLIKYVNTPYYTKEMINNERGIITEEIKMYEDNPETELYYGLFNNLFINDEHQYLISGTIGDVKKITLDDVLNAYEAFYHPANMFITITGNFNPEEALAIINEGYSLLKINKYYKPEIKAIKEPFKVKMAYTTKEMNVDIPKVSIGFKIPKENFKSLKISNLEIKLYINLYIRVNYGITSILNDELQSNKILTEPISTALTETEEYYIETIIGSTNYPDYFIKKVKETFTNGSVNNDDLNRKVNASISNLIMMFDDIEEVNMEIEDDVISYGKYINEIYDINKDLNIVNMEKVIHKLKKNISSISILKPKNFKSANNN